MILIPHWKCFPTRRPTPSYSYCIGTLRQAGTLTTLCSCGLVQREDPVHKGDAGGASPGRHHQAPSREGRGHHPGSWLHHLKGTYKNRCIIYHTYFAKSTDPPFRFDADPDPDPISKFLYTNWKIRNLVFTFILSITSLCCFIFLISVIGFTIFCWTAY
jgi:hypothetical protein